MATNVHLTPALRSSQSGRVLLRMAQISDDAAGWGTGNRNAGGPVYPLANRWDEESRDDAHTLGIGFRYAFARVFLGAGPRNYTVNVFGVFFQYTPGRQEKTSQ